MGPRIFTIQEANSLIPALEAKFQEIDAVRKRLHHIKGKLDVLEMIWGEEIRSATNPDQREYQHYAAEVEKLKLEFDGAARTFTEMDVCLKGVDSGLVDFYGVVDSRLVFLCWKRGEHSVEWYHPIEDGFAGRQPIPSRMPAGES